MREPDFAGPYGKAWKMDMASAAVKYGADPATMPTIACWVIHAPQSHPFWPWLRITLIHLRPVQGMPDAHIYLPGATHEFHVAALDPDAYPPSVDDIPTKTLSPLNFAAQWFSASDQQAIDFIEQNAVQAIVNGFLNPDTDGRQGWVARFGDNMVRR